MTQDGWRAAIIKAVRDADAGDRTFLDLMASLLTEQDQAKNRLRELGYGCTGTPWPRVIDEVGQRP